MALLERLQRRHEVVAARDARRDDALGDAGRDGALDDGRDGVHGPDDFGLELRGHVQFDLLEEVFGGAEAADDEDVLVRCQPLWFQGAVRKGVGEEREGLTWSILFWAWMAMIWFRTSSRMRFTTGSKHCRISSFVNVM